MAKVPNKIIRIIKEFLQELERNQIHINKAILFGSYVNGTFNAWSDIDIALVSSAFKGDRFEDRNMIRKIKLAVSSELEPLPFRPEDFSEENPFIRKIVESGLSISL